jgi:RES domain-containing protein
MQVWRITKSQYVKTAFSGLGAVLEGGRWNHTGHKMVYTSSTLSLATLELHVHLEPFLIPDNLRAVAAAIPDTVSIEEVAVESLPDDWRNFPGPTSLKDFGTQWLQELRSFALIVPSAVNPEEKNILLNPLHPESARLAVTRSQDFGLDPRIWRSNAPDRK